MGLETTHPNVLPKLNKQLTPKDFKKAAGFLRANQIDVRAFILLNPPYLTGQKENIEGIDGLRFRFADHARGSRTVARAPSPSSRLTRRISPPWARAICCASASPTPLPVGLVV